VSDAIVDALSFVRFRELILRAEIEIEQSCLRLMVALCRHLGNCDLASLFIGAGHDELMNLARVRLSAAKEWTDRIARNIWKCAIEQLLLLDFGQLSHFVE
jgi:hypothetical protein